MKMMLINYNFLKIDIISTGKEGRASFPLSINSNILKININSTDYADYTLHNNFH